MFGIYTFIQSIVRQQRFWNNGHEEMRGDSLQLDWLQSFLFYIYFSISLHYFLSWSSLIQLQVTYGWTKTFLSSRGTEVNKNSTSYTSVVSPQKKKKKKKKKKKQKKEKKNKERVWGQTTLQHACLRLTCT